MDKHSLQFIDSRLTVETAPQYSLNIVLGADSISLLVAHHSTGEVAALQTWLITPADQQFEAVEWEIRRILRDDAVFHWPYMHIHCALFHRNSTLVPRRLFQHSALSGYFNLLLPPSEFTFGYDELPEIDAYLVYATTPGHAKLCQEIFPRARVRHLAVPLIRCLRTIDGVGEHRIFVNFRHQVAQIAVFERQNLLFYNTFAFSASSDLLYYVLLAYDQFRLSPLEIPLNVSGNLLVDSDVYRLLQRFIREIKFTASTGVYHLPPGAQVLPAHCHLDLYALKNI